MNNPLSHVYMVSMFGKRKDDYKDVFCSGTISVWPVKKITMPNLIDKMDDLGLCRGATVLSISYMGILGDGEWNLGVGEGYE